MPLRVGDIETVASIRFDDTGAERYERRTRALRSDARKDIVTEAKLDVDKDGFNRYERGVKRANRANDDLVRGSGRLRTSLGSLFVGGAGVAGAAIGLGALAKGAVSVNGAFEESQKVAAQTAAVIKSTGGAARVSADEVAELSGAISKKTAIDDEAIQSGANMLLTFKNVRNEAGAGNDVFSQATRTLTDMSTALGTDASTSAIQLGKALNDPMKGITALSRVGVTFTDQQKEQIETLVESGRTMDAQKIILRELNSEFGGSAEAQATASGRMKVSLGNLAESAGSVVAPALAKVTGWVSDFADEMVEGEGRGGRFVSFLKGAWGVIRDGADALQDARDWVRDLFAAGDGGGGQLGRGLQTARQYATELWATARRVAAGVAKAFEGAGPSLAIIGRFLRDVLGRALTFVYNVARRALPGIEALIVGLANVVRGVVDVIAGLLTGDFGRVWDGVKRIVSGAVRAIGGLVRTLTAPFREVFASIGRIVGNGIGDVVAWFRRLPGRIADALSSALRRVRDWAGDIVSAAVDAGRRMVSRFIDRLEALPGQIAGVGRSALRRVRGWVSDFGDAAYDVGAAIVRRVVRGVTSLPGRLAEAGRSIGRSLLNAVKSFLGINSPSKAFEEVGLNMVQGLARGLDKGDIVGIAKKAFGGMPKLAARLIKKGLIKASSLPGAAIDKLGDAAKGLAGLLGLGGDGGGKAPSGSRDTVGIWNYLASRFNLRKTSGYRSPAHNAAVGGVANSSHTRGTPSRPGAIDLVGPMGAMQAASRYAARFKPIENMIHDAGSGLHLHLAFFKRGGVAGPGEGGPAVVFGEGAKKEWWISQEGDKSQNVAWGVEALQSLTGRKVAFMRKGGTLGQATARVARGERGIVAADQRIERLEREYQQADRRFNLTAEEFITEDAAGVAHLDKAAIAARAGELQALYAKRSEIRQWLRILRDRVRRLIAVMKVAISRLTRAGKTGKKSRRAGYRQKADEIRGRRDQLVDRERLMDLDIIDADLDLSELGNERASVLGTALPPAPAATSEAPSVADPAGATDPAPAAPTAEQIAEAAAAQFAAFQSAREQLFGSFGGNMAARGSDPYATPTGAAAGAQYFGAVPGARAVAGAGGRVTYIEAAEFVSNFASGPPSGDTFVQQQQREVQVGFS